MDIERLDERHEAAVEERLDEERIVNLFLRGFLAHQPMDRGAWYGVRRGGGLGGLVLVLHGRLAVPWSPDLAEATALGAWLRRRHPPCMMVGPRDQVDAIWAAWAPDVRTRRFYDQRLYIADTAPSGAPTRMLRKARSHEWPLIAANAARMEFEDLGRDPALDDPELHARVVQDRIRAGKTWVMERDGHLVFQVNLGTTLPDGCQIGGTYVPPRFRGQGLSTVGMHATLHRLLQRVPRITLHVNEANPPAVRCYERVGFRPYAAYRLLTLA